MLNIEMSLLTRAEQLVSSGRGLLLRIYRSRVARDLERSHLVYPLPYGRINFA